MRLYRIFADICKKHNLRYFGIQGTTLGVIFWDGFIPWDDDMDLAMPISDYERFRKIAKKELPKKFEFMELKWCGGKIHDTTTTFIEATDTMNPEKWHGVFIDIVPLIALPDNERERREFQDEIWSYHVEAICAERYPLQRKRSVRELAAWRKSLLHRYEYGKTKYITDFSFGYYYQFKTEGFNSPLKRKFEGEDMYISSTYDYDLKSRYGKYCKNPPKRDVYDHRSGSTIDLDKPYSRLEKDLNKVPDWVKCAFNKEIEIEGMYYSSFQWAKRKMEEHQKEYVQLLNSKTYRLGNLIARVPRMIIKSLGK